MCAEKIAAIMQHYPEYLAKAYPAREFALSHFDIATTAQNYIKAYQTP